MATRYLYSSDRIEFLELDRVYFGPQSHDGQEVTCISLVPLPPGGNAILVSSDGHMHFLMVREFRFDLAGGDSDIGCVAIITESVTPEADEARQIPDLFLAIDAAGGARMKSYKRAIPTDESGGGR